MGLWIASLLVFKDRTSSGITTKHTQAYFFCTHEAGARSFFMDLCKKEYPESEGYFDHDVSVGLVPVQIARKSD